MALISKQKLNSATPTEYAQLTAQSSIAYSSVVLKETTGDPTTTAEGVVCINHIDHTIRMYAAGVWVTIGVYPPLTGLRFPLTFPLTF